MLKVLIDKVVYTQTPNLYDDRNFYTHRDEDIAIIYPNCGVSILLGHWPK